MLEIFDRNRRRTAILENAHSITEDQKINSLWYLTFSLPYGDPKNEFCQPYHYVRMGGGELYRIMPSAVELTETGSIEYQCEHVLATLLDKTMFGHYTVGNLGVYTADCINYVLGWQEVKNWVLWECDFRRQFEYSWEQENLLSALFSIATPLSDYMWVTDTSVYPWRLSLKALNTDGVPALYVRRGMNMLSYSRESDPQQICTRLYPLGYGEGVNQLSIREVNGGIPYLQSPQQYIDRYGLIERVWADRRYEDAESLKAAAEVMLTELQEPAISYEIGLAELDGRAKIGERVRIMHPDGGWTDTFITGLNYSYDDVTASTVTVANKSTSIATSIADLADRQRIEQTYAQGATQIYSQALQANCDTQTGAVIDFFIPSEMRIINKVLAKIRMSRFLAYSKTTETSPMIATTTSTVDEVSKTSAASGSVSGTTDTQSLNFKTDDGYVDYIAADDRWSFSHYHTVFATEHSHNFHINSHTHEFTIPSHRHEFTMPAHAHDIIPGIYKFGDAKNFSVYVGRDYKGTFSGTSAEIDITSFLLGDDNKIPRGQWLSVEVRPDDLAYISIDLIFQGFVQSRGDNTV